MLNCSFFDPREKHQPSRWSSKVNLGSSFEKVTWASVGSIRVREATVPWRCTSIPRPVLLGCLKRSYVLHYHRSGPALQFNGSLPRDQGLCRKLGRDSSLHVSSIALTQSTIFQGYRNIVKGPSCTNTLRTVISGCRYHKGKDS